MKNKTHPLATELRREAVRLYQTRKGGQVFPHPLNCVLRAVMREAPEVMREFEATGKPHLALSLSPYGIDEITFNDYHGETEPTQKQVRILIKRCEENDS